MRTEAAPARRWGIRQTATAVLLLVMVGATASVWRAPAEMSGLVTATVRPDQVTRLHTAEVAVQVPAGAVDRPARLSVGPPTQIKTTAGVRSGPAYPVHVDGAALRAPVTVSVRLPGGVDDDAVPWLGHRRWDGTWTAEPARYDPATETVTAEVADLSLFAVQWLDLGGLRDRLGELFTSSVQGLSEAVVFGSPAGAPAPLCPHQDEAARRGITVQVSGQPLPVCVGMTDGRVRVQLANSRPYPVLLRYPDAARLRQDGGGHVDIAAVTELITAWLHETEGVGAVVLRPGQSAQFEVDPVPAQVVLHAEPSSAALLGAILDSAVNMLATVYLGMARAGLVRLPPGVSDPVALAQSWNLVRCGPKVFDAAASDALLDRLPQVVPDLVGCLADVARQAMGGGVLRLLAGVVSAAVSVVVPLVRQLIGSVSALADIIRGADITLVTLRQNPANPTALPAGRVDSPVTLFLVDVSGSMADDDGEGTVKIDGAKHAVHTALDNVPAGALVGLRTYPDPGASCGVGSPRAGWVAASDPHLRGTVNELTASGQTPTAAALRGAADHLLSLGLTQPATITLVSDGLSNCGADPCATAEEIAEQGLAIVHTVGFQISPQGRAELDCISQATGGSYFDAGDSQALAASLRDAAAPRLELALDGLPAEPVPAGALVTVAATVTNTSPLWVDDVRLLLTFPADGDRLAVAPPVTGPLRALGNLAAGQSQTLRWQYRVPPEPATVRNRLTVAAAARNAATVRVDGEVAHAGGVSLELAGPLLRDAQRVAILGDSFSSGQGAGDYRPGTAIQGVNQCHRSDRTYTMSLGWPHPPALLACSGATTDHLRGLISHNGERSQLARLRDLEPRPDLVLLTVGGNDVGFGDVIRDCVLLPSCQDNLISPNPQLDPGCRLRYQREVPGDPAGHDLDGCPPFTARYADQAFGRVASLSRVLTDTYAAIDRAVNSPDALADRGRPAHIVVLTYPALLPHTAEHYSSCGLGLNPAEVRFGAELTDRLNQTIEQTVQQLRDQGRPIYAATDVADAFQPNHTVCNRDPHVVPVSVERAADPVLPGRQGSGEQMHPTAEGYRDMTAALLRWSHRPDAQPDVDVAPAPPVDLTLQLPQLDRTIVLGPAPDVIVESAPAGTAALIQGHGFAPGSTVRIDLQSAPRGVATGNAGADGTIITQVPLAADLAPGLHTLTASGVDPHGQPLRRYAVVHLRRPDQPWRTGLAGLAVALLLAAAAGALYGHRRAPNAAGTGHSVRTLR